MQIKYKKLTKVSAKIKIIKDKQNIIFQLHSTNLDFPSRLYEILIYDALFIADSSVSSRYV